jgi:uncharacterized membrane protein
MRVGCNPQPRSGEPKTDGVGLIKREERIMADIVVLAFDEMTTADEAAEELQLMQSEGLLSLSDWARVIRKPDGKIDVKQSVGTAGTGAAGGALWGMLFGLIFLVPNRARSLVRPPVL